MVKVGLAKVEPVWVYQGMEDNVEPTIGVQGMEVSMHMEPT